MGASASSEPSGDVLRGVDSAALLAEVSRRGLGVEDAAPLEPPQKRARQSHVVGELRAADEFSEGRAKALGEALSALGVDAADLKGGPPLKAYHSYIRPRAKGDGQQSVENAAHQIAFLQRHELTRVDEHFRNSDLAAKAREAAGLTPHPITIVLDNVRSAENVGSIFRSADCGRRPGWETWGFTLTSPL